MKRIPVYVPEDHYEELRRKAYENHNSLAEEIRKAIAEYLRKAENNNG